MSSKVFAAILCLFAGTTVFAQGVKTKKAFEAANTEITSYAPQLKEKCGHDVKASLNQASFGTAEDQVNTASWGKDTMGSISSLCEDKDYKEAISKAIKQVVFKYDAALKKDDHYGNKFELKNGTFTHSFNKDSANTGSEAREWLQKNL